MTLIIPVSGMKKKIIIFAISFIVVLFIYVSFMYKITLTAEKFKTKAESLNFEVIDIKDQYTSNEDIEEAFSAKLTITEEEQEKIKENDKEEEEDDSQVIFYVFKDLDGAIKMFNTYNSLFEDFNGLAATERTAKRMNYSSYTLLIKRYYMHICRVDNTLLYVRVKAENREEYKKLIKELGY